MPEKKLAESREKSGNEWEQAQNEHSDVNARSEVLTKCSRSTHERPIHSFLQELFLDYLFCAEHGAGSDKQDRHGLSPHTASYPMGIGAGSIVEKRHKVKEERCGGTGLCAHQTCFTSR